MNNEYLIYCRKSTDEVDNQKNSLEVQEKECKKFAESNWLKISQNSILWIMENWVIKESHSAFKTWALKFWKDWLMEYQIERPKFMQMIWLLIEKKYKWIICLCWDRISRNEKDDMVVKELIDTHKIDIHFVQTQYDKWIWWDLHRDIDWMFAKHYSRTISVKVKTTFEKLIKEKRCLYRSPIWYLDEWSDSKPIDPNRWPIVKDLLIEYSKWWHSTNTLRELAIKKWLTIKPPKSWKLKTWEKYIPKPISRRWIESILHDKFYAWFVKFRWEWYEWNHTPLISLKTFNLIQSHLSNKCTTVRYEEEKYYTYRWIIKCTCWRVYSPEIKKWQYVYYSARCKNDCNNTKKCIKEKELDEIISFMISKLSFTKKQLDKIRQEFEKDIDNVANKRETKFKELTDKKSKLFVDYDFLKKNKLQFIRDWLYTTETYLEEEKRLTKEMKDIDKMFQIQTETEIEMLNFVSEFSELVVLASELYKRGFEKEKREIFDLVFSELVLKDWLVAWYKAKEKFKNLLKWDDENPSQMAWNTKKPPFWWGGRLHIGWGRGIRTPGWQDQNLQPYHLASPQ